MVQITESILKLRSRNRPGKENKRQYITVHNTGNYSKGANAKAHASYLQSAAAQKDKVSWHYTVDDKEIYQHLPYTESAYHAGDGTDGTGNRHSIGIEICVNSDGDIKKATDNAAEFVGYLCYNLSIPVSNVVQHNHWTGKNCPAEIRKGNPYNWASFLERVNIYYQKYKNPPTQNKFYRVRKSWTDVKSQKGAFIYMENAIALVNKLEDGYFVFDEDGKVIYPTN